MSYHLCAIITHYTKLNETDYKKNKVYLRPTDTES